jgi:hypothetical protein
VPAWNHAQFDPGEAIGYARSIPSIFSALAEEVSKLNDFVVHTYAYILRCPNLWKAIVEL